MSVLELLSSAVPSVLDDEQLNQCAAETVKVFLKARIVSSSTLRDGVPLIQSEVNSLVEQQKSIDATAVESHVSDARNACSAIEEMLSKTLNKRKEIEQTHSALKDPLLQLRNADNKVRETSEKLRKALQKNLLHQLRLLGWPISARNLVQKQSISETESRIHQLCHELDELQNSFPRKESTHKDSWSQQILKDAAQFRIRAQFSTIQPDPAGARFAAGIIRTALRELRGIAQTSLQSIAPKIDEDLCQMILAELCAFIGRQVDLKKEVDEFAHAMISAVQKLNGEGQFHQNVSALNVLVADKKVRKQWTMALARRSEKQAQEGITVLFPMRRRGGNTIIDGSQRATPVGLDIEVVQRKFSEVIARVDSLVWTLENRAYQHEMFNAIELPLLGVLQQELFSAVREAESVFESGADLYSSSAYSVSSSVLFNAGRNNYNELWKNNGMETDTASTAHDSVLRAMRAASVASSIAVSLRDRAEEPEYVRLYVYTASGGNPTGSLFDETIRRFDDTVSAAMKVVSDALMVRVITNASSFFKRIRSLAYSSSNGNTTAAELLNAAHNLQATLAAIKDTIADDFTLPTLIYETSKKVDEWILENVLLTVGCGEIDESEVTLLIPELSRSAADVAIEVCEVVLNTIGKSLASFQNPMHSRIVMPLIMESLVCLKTGTSSASRGFEESISEITSIKIVPARSEKDIRAQNETVRRAEHLLRKELHLQRLSLYEMRSLFLLGTDSHWFPSST